MNKLYFLLPASLLALSLSACNGEESEEEDPAEHACEHIGVSGTSVTASETLEDAPLVEVSEEPYTISLVSGAPGFISVDVAEDTAALLLVDTADVVTGIYHDGVEETLAEGAPNEFCAEDIPEHFDLDMHPGVWTIELGPAAVDSIWLMVIAAEGHAHDE